ncbi:hypothetical protein GCM10027176_84780 [Actinoallomurus bryophytorum]
MADAGWRTRGGGRGVADAGWRTRGGGRGVADAGWRTRECLLGKDRDVLGGRRDASDVTTGLFPAVLVPRGFEEQRLRRHAVVVDPIVHHHAEVRPFTGQYRRRITDAMRTP